MRILFVVLLLAAPPPDRGSGPQKKVQSARARVNTEADLTPEDRARMLTMAGTESRLKAWLHYIDVLKETKVWQSVVVDCSPSKPESDLLEAVLNDEVWLDLSRGQKLRTARVLAQAWQDANRSNQPDLDRSEVNLRNHRGVIVAGYQRGRDFFAGED